MIFLRQENNTQENNDQRVWSTDQRAGKKRLTRRLSKFRFKTQDSENAFLPLSLLGFGFKRLRGFQC